MAFIASESENACLMAERNKCHASLVARVRAFLYPKAITTIATEFIIQEVIFLLATHLSL